MSNPGYLWERGDRVQLVYTPDPETRLRPGDRGTVMEVEATGTILVRWDNGSQRGIIPGVDQIKPVL